MINDKANYLEVIWNICNIFHPDTIHGKNKNKKQNIVRIVFTQPIKPACHAAGCQVM